MSDFFVTAFDSNDKPMLCGCGNIATHGIIGKEAFQMWCEDCRILVTFEAKFVYKPPDPVEYAKHRMRCLLSMQKDFEKRASTESKEISEIKLIEEKK